MLGGEAGTPEHQLLGGQPATGLTLTRAEWGFCGVFLSPFYFTKGKIRLKSVAKAYIRRQKQVTNPGLGPVNSYLPDNRQGKSQDR